MYKIGQTVIIKKTGEKKKIRKINLENGEYHYYLVNGNYSPEGNWFKESELELYTKKKCFCHCHGDTCAYSLDVPKDESLCEGCIHCKKRTYKQTLATVKKAEKIRESMEIKRVEKLDLAKVRKEKYTPIRFDHESEDLIREIVAREINLIENAINQIIDTQNKILDLVEDESTHKGNKYCKKKSNPAVFDEEEDMGTTEWWK